MALFGKRIPKQELAEMRPRLYRAALSWTRDQQLAEDLVNETLLKALKNLRSLNEAAALGVWLFRIMANTHKDWLRARREFLDVDTVELHGDSNPESEYERAAIVSRVQDAIGKLNDDHRKVLTLVDLNGFSYKEVSGILDIPVGTVMSRVSRARQQLKEQLGAHTQQVQDNVTYLNKV